MGKFLRIMIDVVDSQTGEVLLPEDACNTSYHPILGEMNKVQLMKASMMLGGCVISHFSRCQTLSDFFPEDRYEVQQEPENDQQGVEATYAHVSYQSTDTRSLKPYCPGFWIGEKKNSKE